MNQEQQHKVEMLAELMNELDVHIWQGVVYVGNATVDHGSRVFLNEAWEWQAARLDESAE